MHHSVNVRPHTPSSSPRQNHLQIFVADDVPLRVQAGLMDKRHQPRVTLHNAQQQRHSMRYPAVKKRGQREQWFAATKAHETPRNC